MGGRGFGSSILTLAVFCLVVVLIAEDIRGYPHRMSTKENDADQFLSADDRLFGNGRQNGRFQRDAVNESSISQPRYSAEDSSIEDMLSDVKIVFPGDEMRLKVPSCNGATYCENVESYPEHLVNNAIRVNGSLRFLAGVDVVPSSTPLVHRIGAMDDVPLCVSMEQVIFPQTAQNKDNQWKYIANQDNFKQGIRIEKCIKENVSCSAIGGAAEGYKTSCKQKYVYRQLASVLVDGTMVQDTFRFPSSCCCHAAFTGGTYARLGINVEDRRSDTTPAKRRRRK